MYKNRKSLIILGLIFGLQVINLFAETNYTLEKCKALALENNTKLKNAELEISASKEIKKSAFTNYFPAIKADAYAFKSEHNLIEYTMKGGNLPVYDGNPANLRNPTQFAYMPDSKISLLNYMISGGFNLTQPIYAGNRISGANELAQLGIDVNYEKWKLLKKEIMLKAEEQYWQIYPLKEKMKLWILIQSSSMHFIVMQMLLSGRFDNEE